MTTTTATTETGNKKMKKVKCVWCEERLPATDEHWPDKFAEMVNDGATVPQATKRFYKWNDATWRWCRSCTVRHLNNKLSQRWWHHKFLTGDQFAAVEQKLTEGYKSDALRMAQSYESFDVKHGDLRAFTMEGSLPLGGTCIKAHDPYIDLPDHLASVPDLLTAAEFTACHAEPRKGEWMDAIRFENKPAHIDEMLHEARVDELTRRVTVAEVHDIMCGYEITHTKASNEYRAASLLHRLMKELVCLVERSGEPRIKPRGLPFRGSEVTEAFGFDTMRQVQQAAEMMSLVTRIGDLSHVLFLDVTMFVRLMDHHVKTLDGCPSYPFSPLGEFVLRRWRNVGEVDNIAELYETLVNAAKTADC